MTYKLSKINEIYRLFIYYPDVEMPIIYESDDLSDVFYELNEWEKLK